ncbi:MAG: S8 family serine peptidase [Verrucomicrobiaceae bacterium]|nr:S8 family serine peptidase [Verrucomicrobiaceae bacterium]
MSQQERSTTSTIVTMVLVLVGLLALVALFAVLRDKVTDAFNVKPPPPPVVPQLKPVELKKPEPVVMNVPTPVVDEDLVALIELLDEPTAVPNEAVLTFDTAEALRKFLASAASLGLRVISSLDAIHGVRVGFGDAETLNRYLKSQKGRPDSPNVEPHFWLTTPQLPKPAKDNQGGSAAVGSEFLTAINAVGDRSAWGKGVTVAVLDTGVAQHPTFGEGRLTHIDLVQDGKTPHSHGTSVASLIAGEDDQVPGVSPAADILDIRVANDQGLSVNMVLAQGIVEAVDRGADVINISLGGYDDSVLLRRAIEYAAKKQVIVVAAAGNDSYDRLAFPAAIERVISVGSVDRNSKQAYFSNSGAGLDISAPGVGLPVAWETQMKAITSGTSGSAGVVTGAVAALLSRGVSPADIVRVLSNSARATGAPRNQVGAGVLWIRN